MVVVKFPTKTSRVWLQIEPRAEAMLAESGLGSQAIGVISNAMRDTIGGLDFEIQASAECSAECRETVEDVTRQIEVGTQRVIGDMLYTMVELMVRVYLAGGELPGQRPPG